MNNFPAMTEEQRQRLTGFIAAAFASMNGDERLSTGYEGEMEALTKQVFEVALAALTAEPAGKFYAGPRGKVSIHPSESLPLGFNPFYTAPPVPVLRPVDLRATLNPDMFNDDVIWGYRKARHEDIEAIKAAGYKVVQ